MDIGLHFRKMTSRKKEKWVKTKITLLFSVNNKTKINSIMCLTKVLNHPTLLHCKEYFKKREREKVSSPISLSHTHAPAECNIQLGLHLLTIHQWFLPYHTTTANVLVSHILFIQPESWSKRQCSLKQRSWFWKKKLGVGCISSSVPSIFWTITKLGIVMSWSVVWINCIDQGQRWLVSWCLEPSQPLCITYRGWNQRSRSFSVVQLLKRDFCPIFFDNWTHCNPVLYDGTLSWPKASDWFLIHCIQHSVNPKGSRRVET